MPLTPDILLTPSRLKTFARAAAGSVLVNPGVLVRGAAAGTYARIAVAPHTPASLRRGEAQDACSRARPRAQLQLPARRIVLECNSNTPSVVAVVIPPTLASALELEADSPLEFAPHGVPERAFVEVVRL